MAEAKLAVLYPQPTDRAQFDRDYQDHLRLVDEKLQIPDNARPYTVTQFTDTPMGRPAYYRMFLFPFASEEALQQVLSSPAMAELAADAARISSGGPPVVLVGVKAV